MFFQLSVFIIHFVRATYDPTIYFTYSLSMVLVMSMTSVKKEVKFLTISYRLLQLVCFICVRAGTWVNKGQSSPAIGFGYVDSVRRIDWKFTLMFCLPNLCYHCFGLIRRQSVYLVKFRVEF